MEAKDWQQEQERLERVRNKLQARIAELEPEVAGLRDQATDIRKRFWEEFRLTQARTKISKSPSTRLISRPRYWPNGSAATSCWHSSGKA